MEPNFNVEPRSKKTKTIVFETNKCIFCSQWNVFLSRGENKSNLAKCYIEYMTKHAGPLLKDNQVLYISGGHLDSAMRIDSQVSTHCASLASEQEEADGRLVLHAAFAARLGTQQIIVNSPDTDVFVLLLHHRPLIKASKIYFLTGHVGKHASLMRYIPIHYLYKKLSREQHNIMLSMYCLSGCDTVSSFYGHGKRTVFRIMMQKADHFQPLAGLGTKLEVSRQERAACTTFVGTLYGKSECDSLDKLRCEKASKNIQPRKLPPTEDSLHQHVLRSVYQLMIWRQACSVVQDIPDPTLYGYFRDTDNSLRPRMMNQEPAAPELLNDLVCDCQGSSCNENCTCLASNQACTAACYCEAQLPIEESEEVCTNPLTFAALYIADSDSDDN